MAEQATGAVEGMGTAGSLAHGTAQAEHNPGKPMSWVSVSVVMVGFIIGGIAFVPGPHWVLFWVAVGIVVIGGIMTLSNKTFNEDWY